MNNELINQTNFRKLGMPKRGKVRDVYDLGSELLIVVTDRISAFDRILPSLIPDKGKVLNQLALYWFRNTEDIIKNHVLEWETQYYPPILKKYADKLEGRSMLVKKAKPLPVECIVRGYISGSGWEKYHNGQAICGITLPPGLLESQKLEKPIFTPTTKAETGHDLPITMKRLKMIVGKKKAETLRDISLQIYERASEDARENGIIIADTKFEFGMFNGELILIDEVLTPDSSRFWSAKKYNPGRSQDSLDKQIVRNYLTELGWNKKPPIPILPSIVIREVADRYQEIFRILTGKKEVS